MLKWLVGLVASQALPLSQSPEFDRVLERPDLYVFFWWPGRIVDYRVADVAVV